MMMTCRLLCTLLVLALFCCPSVCVTATGGEKAVKIPDPAVQKASDPLAAPEMESDGDTDCELEPPEPHTAGPTNRTGSTTLGSHTSQSEDLYVLKNVTNPKGTLRISKGGIAVTPSGAPAPPGTPSPTKDNREPTVLAIEPAQTQGVIGNSGTENKKLQENTGVENHKEQASRQEPAMPNTNYNTTTKTPPLGPPTKNGIPATSTELQNATIQTGTNSPSHAETAPEAPESPSGNGAP
ncbi:mucin TcMUCII, putative, partial [Trypanosoma cruzi marinkellei]